MPATPAWLAAAESVLNRNIADSTQAAALARRLEDTSLELDIDGLALIRISTARGALAFSTVERGLHHAAAVASAAAAPAADATISGSVAGLLGMLKGGRPTPASSRPAVQIRGDAQVANLYRELLAAARPDPEEELARVIGDLPARRLSQLAAGVRAWAQRARRTAGENIAEYLQEEGRDLVAKSEAEEFLRGVDEIREAADRVEARLKSLELRVRAAP